MAWDERCAFWRCARGMHPQHVVVDAAYDSDSLRNQIRKNKGRACIRPPSSEGTRYAEQVDTVALIQRPKGNNWIPGNALLLVLDWAVAKAGTLSIVGVYPQKAPFFDIGTTMNKNITIQVGNCPHRKYLSRLVERVHMREIDPLSVLPCDCRNS